MREPGAWRTRKFPPATTGCSFWRDLPTWRRCSCNTAGCSLSSVCWQRQVLGPTHVTMKRVVNTTDKPDTRTMMTKTVRSRFNHEVGRSEEHTSDLQSHSFISY